MDELLAERRAYAIELCRFLSSELRTNESDAAMIFGGEVYKTYAMSIDMAQEKVCQIRSKLLSLK